MIAAPTNRTTLFWLDLPLARLVLPVERMHDLRRSVSLDSPDSVLIDGTLRGNERAFRVLVERYQTQIVRTVTGMLGQTADVDDTVQEVFIRFHTALPRFRGQSSVKTYLTRIAINRSLDVLRSRRRRLFVSWEAEQTQDVASELPKPDDVAVQADEHRQLRSAINTLSTRHKAVVVLRLIDGLTTQETAEVLEVPYGTVLSRLKRALAKLKETLGDSLGGSIEPL